MQRVWGIGDWVVRWTWAEGVLRERLGNGTQDARIEKAREALREQVCHRRLRAKTTPRRLRDEPSDVTTRRRDARSDASSTQRLRPSLEGRRADSPGLAKSIGAMKTAAAHVEQMGMTIEQHVGV